VSRSTLVTGGLACALGAACTSAPATDVSGVTYYKDIAPLVARECASCHRDGGAAGLPLETFDQTAELAPMLARITADRRMPPWPADASGDCNTFVDQRWLSDADLALFAAWADAGAPAGDPAHAPELPRPLETHYDKSVTIAPPAPYAVAPHSDEYRCFVVDPGIADERFITAIGLELDRAEVVHHMQLYAIDDDAADAAVTALDAQDAAPGYRCGEEGLGADLRYVGVWAPGDLVRRWPDGTGIALHAGRRLVLQLHYHNHAAVTIADQTRVGLELAESVAELGDIHHARNTELVLMPGRANIKAVGTHALDITEPVTARGVRIHMHVLGTSGRLELLRGDETRCLLSIPRWDFDWQLFYLLRDPIQLLPGDQVRLTCTYDTRSQDNVVRWGTSTDDEMCIGYTYFTR
jgi:hypothetical protein